MLQKCRVGRWRLQLLTDVAINLVYLINHVNSEVRYFSTCNTSILLSFMSFHPHFNLCALFSLAPKCQMERSPFNKVQRAPRTIINVRQLMFSQIHVVYQHQTSLSKVDKTRRCRPLKASSSLNVQLALELPPQPREFWDIRHIL